MYMFKLIGNSIDVNNTLFFYFYLFYSGCVMDLGQCMFLVIWFPFWKMKNDGCSFFLILNSKTEKGLAY